eukprot:TRINITY_DN65358_c0_g1_i1.p1 TRINITY_DN65358_c0_g1~~TRINITY_DN65358_c0_g1_i1.p1  ORF type:complete len:559 (+),score=152.06 TRINITY_DN65358_c0_g1_i1:48-1679(+)
MIQHGVVTAVNPEGVCGGAAASGAETGSASPPLWASVDILALSSNVLTSEEDVILFHPAFRKTETLGEEEVAKKHRTQEAVGANHRALRAVGAQSAAAAPTLWLRRMAESISAFNTSHSVSPGSDQVPIKEGPFRKLVYQLMLGERVLRLAFHRLFPYTLPDRVAGMMRSACGQAASTTMAPIREYFGFCDEPCSNAFLVKLMLACRAMVELPPPCDPLSASDTPVDVGVGYGARYLESTDGVVAKLLGITGIPSVPKEPFPLLGTPEAKECAAKIELLGAASGGLAATHATDTKLLWVAGGLAGVEPCVHMEHTLCEIVPEIVPLTICIDATPASENSPELICPGLLTLADLHPIPKNKMTDAEQNQPQKQQQPLAFALQWYISQLYPASDCSMLILPEKDVLKVRVVFPEVPVAADSAGDILLAVLARLALNLKDAARFSIGAGASKYALLKRICSMPCITGSQQLLPYAALSWASAYDHHLAWSRIHLVKPPGSEGEPSALCTAPSGAELLAAATLRRYAETPPGEVFRPPAEELVFPSG